MFHRAGRSRPGAGPPRKRPGRMRRTGPGTARPGSPEKRHGGLGGVAGGEGQWRQIQPLAAAGFRVVAPDMRGYNLSSRPDDVAAYDSGQLRKSWYFFFALPDLPETVVHANHWHFFRHFLHDARPAYTPEEIDRYIEAWSQPGAASEMIN
jgi:pimeloyl-ACP methyl ester carboxylesterase